MAASELDPQIAAFLQTVAELDPPPARLETLTPDEARALRNSVIVSLAGTLTAVANVDNMTIPGPQSEIPARVYRPAGSGRLPVVVYYHGGGWVYGDLDTHDNVCRSLANAAACVVVSVDYRLAPEHKFPAAADDAYAALKWVAQADNAANLNVDAKRIAVAGDSAGGNLAAVVALMARDRGGPPLLYQVMVYPVTDLSSTGTNSYQEYAEGFPLTKPGMVWFIDHYLASESDGRNPYASPLLAGDLSGLPPAMLMTAHFDVLADEGIAYAERLQAAGVPSVHKHYDTAIHGFWAMAGVTDLATDAINEAAKHLRAAFAQ